MMADLPHAIEEFTASPSHRMTSILAPTRSSHVRVNYQKLGSLIRHAYFPRASSPLRQDMRFVP